MAIVNADIALLLSAGAGSNGGAISGSSVTSGVSNNVWPDVSDASRLAGGEDERKVFWKNNSGSSAALVPILYAPVLPTNCTLSLGYGVNDANDADPLQGNMSPLGAASVVAVVSDGADTRQATVVGLNNAGTPVPTVETVTLNGLTEVLTATTWSKVYAVYVSAIDASRTVTAKQGAGGATRGVIGPSKKVCWLWIVSPSAKAAGIALTDLAAGGIVGMWMRIVWTAGVASVRPNTMTVQFEENA